MKLNTERKLLDTFSFSSLTDIVLLLLIFFLLSSTFIVQPGIKVQLPKAESSAEILDKSITVIIAPDGLYYINDLQVILPELGARLNSLAREFTSDLVIIKADESVATGRLVEVMDICLKAGLSKFSIATEPVYG